MISNAAPGSTSRRGFMQHNERKGFTIAEFAILRAALQARERLAKLYPNPESRLRDIRLLHLGQGLLHRLQAAGVKLPEVDLSQPQTAPAQRSAAVTSTN
jgi:hypothetical protein